MGLEGVGLMLRTKSGNDKRCQPGMWKTLVQEEERDIKGQGREPPCIKRESYEKCREDEDKRKGRNTENNCSIPRSCSPQGRAI